jgi:hypothetical protein
MIIRNLIRQSILPILRATSCILRPLLEFHRPLPSFSFSAQLLCRKRGRLLKPEDTLLACFENHPVLRVVNDGYPLTSALLACADAQVTLFGLPFAYLIGLALLLELLYGVVNPGLDHPPPRCGEGERESDIWSVTSRPGVGGTAGSGCTKRLAGCPEGDSNVDEALRCCKSRAFGVEERRRRCCEEVAAGGG